MNELVSMRYLLAVAEHGTISKAAQALRISQPAITRSVQRLERSLGVALLDRDGHSAHVNAFGRAVADHARRLSDAVDRVRAEIDALRDGAAGTVRVGVGPFVAELLVPCVVRAFCARHPQVRLVIVPGDWDDLTAAVRGGRLDLFVGDVSAAEKDEHVVFSALPAAPLHAFARKGHPLTAHRRLHAGDFGRYPIAGPRPAPWAEPWLRKARAAAGRPVEANAPVADIECASYAVVKRIVQQTDAVSLAPKAIVAAEVERGELEFLALRMPRLQSHAGFVFPLQRMLSPATRAFMREFEAAAQAIVSESAERQR
jgi:DNA-binding transcriptional LysR family regulator